MSRPLSAPSAIRLVAEREIASRVRSRAFVISNVLVLAVIVIGIAAFAVLRSDGSAYTLGLVGNAQNLAPAFTSTAEAFDVDVELVDLDDAAAGRAQVAADELDVVLLPSEGGGYVAVTQSTLPPDLEAVVRSTVNDATLNASLEELGVDRGELDESLAAGAVTVEPIDPPDPEEAQRTALAYLAVLVIFFQIFVFGLYVATGVIEEKASRIVELLLSTIRPVHLLVGKIVGLGVIGLGQLVAYGAVALVAGIATDLVTVTGTAIAVFAVVLAWFVLGFAFFGVLYAAAGSMVSRQEDVNATTTPINILAFAVFFSAQFALSDPDGTLASVLSWIPPFSSALMPLRVAAGDTSLAQVIGSAAVMVGATVVLAVIAARIYERSILRTGGRVSLKDALGSSSPR